VEIEALNPYPTKCGGGRAIVSLGDLVAEQRLEVVLRLNFPYGEIGRETGAVTGLADRDGTLAAESVKLGWEYADGRTNDLQERDLEVDRAVARIFAARARQEALGLNRVGDYKGARDALCGVARRIRDYAGRDTELREIVAGLERETELMAAPMAELTRKQMYAESAYVAKMRMADGSAMRGPKPDPR
jgi:hypothetical protein